MLRRKLMMTLGPLVGVLLVVAIVAIVALQGVLTRMDHIRNYALTMIDRVNQLGATITSVEAELDDLQLGRKRHLDALIEAMTSARQQVAVLGEHYLITESEAGGSYGQLLVLLPQFERHVGSLATARNRTLAHVHSETAQVVLAAIRREILQLGAVARDHLRAEQHDMTVRFRWLVLGLTVVFLLLINLAVVALLRIAGMVLRPVDQLVHASRQLAAERFDHRVQLNQRDEFDELAKAYNQLAEQLQANEQRKLEMLSQVALTLNHELNNAITIIEMQLKLLGRKSDSDGELQTRLQQIRETLARMSKTVDALKHVRRIVLTEYVNGVKMLDLEQSTAAAQDAGPTDPRRDEEASV